MCRTVRKTLRSWMFIYTGFVAAIALASQPIGGAGEANFDNPDRPLVSDAPLGRSDI